MQRWLKIGFAAALAMLPAVAQADHTLADAMGMSKDLDAFVKALEKAAGAKCHAASSTQTATPGYPASSAWTQACACKVGAKNFTLEVSYTWSITKSDTKPGHVVKVEFKPAAH